MQGSVPGSAVAFVQESSPGSVVASVQESIPGSARKSMQGSVAGSAVVPVNGLDSCDKRDPALSTEPLKLPSLSPPPAYSSHKPSRSVDPPLLSASAPNHLFSTSDTLSPPPTYLSHEMHTPALAPAPFPPLELMRPTPRSSPPAHTLQVLTPPRGNQLIFQPTPGTPPKSSTSPTIQSLHNSDETIGDGIQNIHDELQSGNSSLMKKDLLSNFDMTESSDPVSALSRAQDVEGSRRGPDEGFGALRASLVAEVCVFVCVCARACNT